MQLMQPLEQGAQAQHPQIAVAELALQLSQAEPEGAKR